MRASKGLQSNLTNLAYYSRKIAELAKKQLDEDIAKGNQIGINQDAAKQRYDALGKIGSSCIMIDFECQTISNCITKAEGVENTQYEQS